MRESYLIERKDEIHNLAERIAAMFLDPNLKRVLVILDTENIKIKLEDGPKVRSGNKAIRKYLESLPKAKTPNEMFRPDLHK